MTSTTPQRFELYKGLWAWKAGSGPLLILVHGVGLNADCWLPLLPHLAPYFTVLAVDLPGHGKSTRFKHGSHAGLQDFSMRIAEILGNDAGAVQRRPAVVIGHSLGALIAMDFAVTAQGNCAGIVALNAIHRRSAAAKRAVQARATALAESRRPDNQGTLERWFGTEPQGADAVHRDHCANMLAACDPEAYAAAYRVFAASEAPPGPALKGCTVPMLFVTGADEPNSTPAMSQALAELAQNGRCAIVGGARHMMPMTHAAKTGQEIMTFAREIGHFHDDA